MNKFIISSKNKNNNVFTFYIVMYSNPCNQTSGTSYKKIRHLFIPGGFTSGKASENVLTYFLELTFKYGITSYGSPNTSNKLLLDLQSFFLTKSKHHHCADSSKQDNRELSIYIYLKVA